MTETELHNKWIELCKQVGFVNPKLDGGYTVNGDVIFTIYEVDSRRQYHMILSICIMEPSLAYVYFFDAPSKQVDINKTDETLGLLKKRHDEIYAMLDSWKKKHPLRERIRKSKSMLATILLQCASIAVAMYGMYLMRTADIGQAVICEVMAWILFFLGTAVINKCKSENG